MTTTTTYIPDAGDQPSAEMSGTRYDIPILTIGPGIDVRPRMFGSEEHRTAAAKWLKDLAFEALSLAEQVEQLPPMRYATEAERREARYGAREAVSER